MAEGALVSLLYRLYHASILNVDLSLNFFILINTILRTLYLNIKKKKSSKMCVLYLCLDYYVAANKTNNG
ncbi:hypothetical protein BpHYR1_044420 [Brachionus plicatilis]|uniref:Uncharacterized protein n=1 Tax=Brachionus plicatilis TaxID=10195 RepID=A0A3M7RHE1_BRAPC|nr:hypothetical protein BpHYR1_044420 [Brachionus plicatilis]